MRISATLKVFNILVVAGLLMTAPSSPAHETEFGHSVRTLYLTSAPGQILIEYRLHLSPEEALAEMARMDLDENGSISAEERAAWFLQKGTRLRSGMKAHRDGRSLELQIRTFKLGHSLTQSFTYAIESESRTLTFEDSNLAHRPGVVRVVHGPDLQVTVLENGPLNHAGFIAVEIAPRKP
ncbi:MAG: hypothetical protein O2923_13545 [Verrucomicrobia bacterium]|nr:hypothetical protein [Verrucomicrobiota bacterium]MDA1086548.1 hypothetical protein [Verrucomicrobiota bacterium]